MPRRQGGLGPVGRRAVNDAAATWQRLNNPAVTTTEAPGEVEEEEDVEPDWVQFTSSRVAEAAYDAKNDRLFVRWVKPGGPYVYEGVPSAVWRDFRRSASPGRFVNRRLNTYNYHPL